MNNDQKQDLIFAEGFNIYSPNEKTAHFLFGKAGMNWEKFKAWGDQHVNEKGYLNLNFPISKKNNEPYAVLDTYKPKPKEEITHEEAVAQYRDAGTPLDDETTDYSNIPW